jgi:hypothetical protein
MLNPRFNSLSLVSSFIHKKKVIFMVEDYMKHFLVSNVVEMPPCTSLGAKIRNHGKSTK